ncbi:MAG: RNA polymerase sigma factor [Opitutales bacterium]|nr:RNA polymerase sigma factor [Opitutales bacterium]
MPEAVLTAPRETPSRLDEQPNDEWFATIAESHYNDLYRFCRSLTFGEAEALDLTQNTFLKLARNLDRLTDRRHIKRWLFNTAHREFIDGYRHRKKFPKLSLHPSAEQDESDRPSLEWELPDQTTVHPERTLDSQTALEALQKIPENYRAPLALFYLENLSYKEISATLDTPIGTIMSRLRRGKDQLRKILEQKASS